MFSGDFIDHWLLKGVRATVSLATPLCGFTVLINNLSPKRKFSVLCIYSVNTLTVHKFLSEYALNISHLGDVLVLIVLRGDLAQYKLCLSPHGCPGFELNVVFDNVVPIPVEKAYIMFHLVEKV